MKIEFMLFLHFSRNGSQLDILLITNNRVPSQKQQQQNHHQQQQQQQQKQQNIKNIIKDLSHLR